MKLTINGTPSQVDHARLTVIELLKIQEVESPDMVSVQLNGDFVERDQFDTTQVRENDTIEFLYFMGGGMVTGSRSGRRWD